MQEFVTFMFHTVVHRHKLGEVKNECMLHDFIVLAILMPKIVKFSKHLTKLWENNFDCFFLRHGVLTAASTRGVGCFLALRKVGQP